jgi:multidrug resistance efflux pump
MKIINVIIAIILISTALLTGSVTWSKYMNSPWTRDGKVRAEVIQVSPQISGRIEEISVQDNQFVHKGDLIFSIDSSDYLIAKNQAQAELEQANFELKQAINILSRDKTLTKKGFISKEQITDEQL